MTDRAVFSWIAAASLAVIGFLFWLLFFHEAAAGALGGGNSALPLWNVAFNCSTVLCLLSGRLAIKSGNKRLHASFMLSALAFSGLFLITYVTYHAIYGDTLFQGQGLIRTVYFSILISHVLLTIVMLPMILTTLYFAGRGRFGEHRRLARVTLPVWLYVSVTGVVILALLRGYQ